MDGILTIILSIVLLVFFSGMQTAFLTASKLRLDLDIKQDLFGSGIIKFFWDNPGQFMATMSIGNIIALTIYALASVKLSNSLLSHLFESDAMLLAANIIISVLLILVIAGLLMKTLFIVSPNFILKLLSVPALIFFYLFYPLSRLMIYVSNILLRPFIRNESSGKIKGNQLYSKFEPDLFTVFPRPLEESTPLDDNIKILQNALDFSSIKIWECMVPRTEIKAVDIDTPVEELKSLLIETQHSRLLVYQDSIDNVIGYFDLKDIFHNPKDIRSYIRKVIIVPETMAASRLLRMFVDQKKNVALVVDEFGGTSGMITIEDVLEEIVGDIEDEHDVNEMTEKALGKDEYIFSARLEIDYLNETYNFDLPEQDDYKTLAGLILFYNGSIPAQNDTVRLKNFLFKVLKVTARRIELVNLKVGPK